MLVLESSSGVGVDAGMSACMLSCCRVAGRKSHRFGKVLFEMCKSSIFLHKTNVINYVTEIWQSVCLFPYYETDGSVRQGHYYYFSPFFFVAQCPSSIEHTCRQLSGQEVNVALLNSLYTNSKFLLLFFTIEA